MPESAQPDYQQALDTAERLLGQPLVLPLAEGEPPVGEDFRRLAGNLYLQHHVSGRVVEL